MPQLHTWQYVHQNSVRGQPENSLHQERTNAEWFFLTLNAQSILPHEIKEFRCYEANIFLPHNIYHTNIFNYFIILTPSPMHVRGKYSPTWLAMFVRHRLAAAFSSTSTTLPAPSIPYIFLLAFELTPHASVRKLTPPSNNFRTVT